MLAEFWVKIEATKKYRSWCCGPVKVSKSKPATKANEVAVKIAIDIPDAYFETPELSAKITVPEDSVNKPVITPQVESNIAKLISEQLGVQVHVSAVEKEEE